MEPRLDAGPARYAPVDVRVSEILENIRRDCRELAPESRNEGNERQVEEFIARLRAEFGERVVIERQRLSAWAVRTTRWNYLFTVPGESDDRIVLVAHYDTWRGPGADDNTTGEEILKQYLIADLRAARRPALTHTYFLAGSEECGLIGLTSQLLLALGLQAANLALTQQNWLYAGVALALAPLAGYRFGVSGSREYVKTLSTEELRRIRGVVSVDSVERRPALHPPRHARRRLPARAHPVRGLRLDQRSPGGRCPSARHQVQQLSRRRNDRSRLVPGGEQRAVGPGAGVGPSPRRPDGAPAIHPTAPHSGNGAGRDGPGQGVPHRVRRQDPHAARYAGPRVRRAVTRDAPHPRLLLPPPRRRRPGR